MQTARHKPEELDAIRKFTVPTLANAIETFGVIPSNEGFCDARMRCHYPDLPLMVGYAVTARVSTDQPPSEVRPGIVEPDYWRWIASQAGPKVAVVQDIDNPPRGAMWGSGMPMCIKLWAALAWLPRERRVTWMACAN